MISAGVHVIASAHGDVPGLVGYEVHEVLASHWWLDHLHPEDRMKVLSAMALLLQDGRWTIEYRCRTKQGGYQWIHDEAVLQRDASGRPVEIIGTWRRA